MIDKEKIKDGLLRCSEWARCINCQYKKYGFLTECTTVLAKDALELVTEQEQYIKALEDKLRLLEYGNQDTFEDTLMPAT